ncbi:hypothetical protein FNV43_RR00869 [Rhamnella rubrinervis]|uniref:AIG1-type G domain-containing protein n=1 Tax=Rhamnella rubrinervis TaxID=2594499 RepID=A0A8K0HPY5_9ROSA|nr:hypothetical protein FNV43_RR00869 [Rhamnella rubrinervis]
MDSKPHVSLSAAARDPILAQSQQPSNRDLSTSSSSSGSFLIRAPLTVDDDDSDFESDGHKFDYSYGSSVSGSDSLSESETFVSGEEFETASERQSVADPDEETLEESDAVEKFELSRPVVAYLNGESSESGVGDGEESGEDDGYGLAVEPNMVDKLSLEQVRPIAQLSMEDDDNDLVSEGEVVSEVKDGRSLGVAKVPGAEFLEKVSIAPRIKMLGVDEEEEEDDETVVKKDSLIVNMTEPAIQVEAKNGVWDISEEEPLGVEDSVQGVLVESIGPGATDEHVESLGVNEKYVIEQRTEPDAEVEHSVGKKQKLEEVVEEAIELNCMDAQNLKSDTYSIFQRQPLGVAEETDDVLERTTFVTDLDLLKEHRSVAYDGPERTHEPVTNILAKTRGPNSMELNVDVLKAEDNVKYVADEPSSIGITGVRLDEGSNDENLESKMDLGVALDNSMATYRQTIYNDIDVNQSQINFNKSLHPNQTRETIYLDNGDLTETSEGGRSEISIYRDSLSQKSVFSSSTVAQEVHTAAKVGVDHDVDTIEEGKGGPVSDEDAEDFVFDSSETTKQFIDELGQKLVSSSLLGSEDHLQPVDGQSIMESDEEDIDRDGPGNKLLDSISLLALLKAATSIDESRSFTLDGSAELGSFPRFARPAPLLGESEDNLSEEDKRKIEKVQLLRVKFFRLVHRLGLSSEDKTVSQVLYKLVLAAGKHSSQLSSTESAKRIALELEADNKSDLDFYVNILVLGKTGVGKSATINSIFGEKKVMIDAFGPATTKVKEIVGTINGVKIRILDTPGLKSSAAEQVANRKILAGIHKSIKKFPPDVVLYVDRLDTQTRSINDLPLLRSITKYLSPSIWRSSVVTLTHAASALPDGPSGYPLSYEVFAAQRSRVVLQSISLASELHLMNPNIVQPVSLIENHPLLGKNEKREKLVSDGFNGSSQLLLLCYSIKVLSEASSISKPQDPFNQQKIFGSQIRPLALPYLLTSLLQSRSHPKLSADQGGNDIDSDIDLANVLDHDSEDEDEYDQLPPFRPLRISQIAKLNKEQRKAYFVEYDYRVKLLEKKQWREEIKRLKEIKNKSKDGRDVYSSNGDDGNMEEFGPEAESFALLDMSLPPSFDGDSPVYRYRFLEPTSQLLVRPVADTNGWDHDCGYDGVSLDRKLAFAGRFPAVFSVQVTKDKKQFNMHSDSSVSMKHGENGSTMAGLDIQTVGKQLAYILRGETKVKNFKINRTTAGVTVTLLGEQVATGLKIEDQIAVGKHLVLRGDAGVVRSQGDTAYGANLEVRLKDEDFPIGQDQSSLGLSLMKWRGDLASTVALQSQFSIGRSSKMAIHVGLNNKRSGQISIKTSSSDQLQIALAGVLPIAVSIFRSFCRNSTD